MPVELILHNAKIATNAVPSLVEAIAVSDGKITAVGNDDGTAIGSAIAAGVNRLRTTAAKSKVIILLTDGMNNTGKISPVAAAEASKAMGVKAATRSASGPLSPKPEMSA